MATSLNSPGVEVREHDLSTAVASVSTTEGAFAGVFRWGPVDQRVLTTSEVALVNTFGKPTNLNPETFFTAASFLAYGNKLYTTRVANTAGVTPTVSCNVTATNASVLLASGTTANLEVGMFVINADNGALANGATIATITNSTAFTIAAAHALVTNTAASVQFVSNTAFSAVANTGVVANLEYSTIGNNSVWDARETTIDTDVTWIAKYPGDLGNSLRVSVCGNAAGHSSTINLATYGTTGQLQVNVNSNTANVSLMGANTDNSANAIAMRLLINNTDLIKVGNSSIGTQYLKVDSLSNTVFYGTVAVNVALTTTVANTTVVSNNTTSVVAGMELTAGNTDVVYMRVASVTNSTAFVVDSAPTVILTADETTISPRATFKINFEDRYSLSEDYLFNSSNTSLRDITRNWEFYNHVGNAPGLSDFQTDFGNNSVTNDEMHVVVTDEDGRFTGVPGTVLETYEAVSLATDGKTVDGAGNFYRDVINQNSAYVRIGNDISTAVSNTALDLTSPTLDVSVLSLQYGNDGKDESGIEIAELSGGFDLYKSAEDIDISIVIQGKARSTTLSNYILDNIVGSRKDAIACISPQYGDVVNNRGNEMDAVVTFRNSLRSTSYAEMDTGYKYMYDRYNNLYRWVPLNGDIAGTMVRTDRTNDPWYSPAGFNRGQIKNVVKLAWNPTLAERDQIYNKSQINPVVTFPGQGTILYGDRTLLSKNSAFDRINVRRLFLVLEKAISQASKWTLFEFNDDFTRLQFKNLVVPYLRDIQGRRGITDFLVVCDGDNNTAEVIDRNEFVGDIYIKPARSINYIQLNFIATRTGVAFSEIVGKFG